MFSCTFTAVSAFVLTSVTISTKKTDNVTLVKATVLSPAASSRWRTILHTNTVCRHSAPGWRGSTVTRHDSHRSQNTGDVHFDQDTVLVTQNCSRNRNVNGGKKGALWKLRGSQWLLITQQYPLLEVGIAHAFPADNLTCFWTKVPRPRLNGCLSINKWVNCLEAAPNSNCTHLYILLSRHTPLLARWKTHLMCLIW